MKQLKLVFVIALLLALTACGGSSVVQNPPPPPPPTKPATTAGAQFGHNGLGVTVVAANTTAQLERRGLFNRLLGALDPKVYADSLATISGSYTGECENIPVFSAGTYTPISGLGNDSGSSQCSSWSTAPQPIGPAVIGPGTLSTLVAFGVGSSTATPTSGKIVVAVNGVLSGITCFIGQQTRCEDTVNASPVNDEDKLSAYLVADGVTSYHNVRVIFLKQ